MSMDWLRKTTAPPPGKGTGSDGRPVVDTDAPRSRAKLASDPDLDGKLVVLRRHVNWVEHQIRWRWLLDSFEGGERYRNAIYGPDRRGLPARNLFRHRREYPDPQMFPNVYQGFAGFLGSVNAQTQECGYGPYPGTIGADPAATALDDDYEYRRSRTPVPEFVAEAVEIHLSKVYDQEVRREGPGRPGGLVEGRGRTRHAGRRLDARDRRAAAPGARLPRRLPRPSPGPAGGEDRDAGRRAAAGNRPLRRQLHPPPEHGLVAAGCGGAVPRVPGPRVREPCRPRGL